MLKYLPLFAVLFTLLALMSGAARAENFPPPGTTFYPMEVDVQCTIYNELGQGVPWYMDDAVGSCNMLHGPAYLNGEGRRQIDLNAGAFVASGIWHYMDGTPWGPADVTVSTCPGKLTSLGWPEGDFPADSFFDVFVTLHTPIGTFSTTQSVQMTGGAGTWTWYYADGGSVPLYGGGPYDMLNMVHFEFDKSVVPEPSGLLALAGGLAPLGLAVRRRLRKS